MIKRNIILLFFGLIFCLSLHSEVVLKLNSGKDFIGTIERQNEDIIVLRTTQGKLFQFPKTDVMEISEIENVTEQQSLSHRSNFSIRIHVDGSYSMLNGLHGYAAGAGLKFGAANLFERQIFIGGGVGVDVYSIGGTRVFVPLCATINIPFLQSDNTPFVGLEAGYGFAMKGAERGGFKGGVSIGWLHRFNRRTATNLSLYADIQQAFLTATENISNQEYSYQANRVLPQLGLRFEIQL